MDRNFGKIIKIQILLTFEKNISIEYLDSNFYLQKFLIFNMLLGSMHFERNMRLVFSGETYLCLQKWKIENEKCIFTLNPTECTKKIKPYFLFFLAFSSKMWIVSGE